MFRTTALVTTLLASLLLVGCGDDSSSPAPPATTTGGDEDPTDPPPDDPGDPGDDTTGDDPGDPDDPGDEPDDPPAGAFAVRGAVAGQAFSVLDSDVNDPSAPFSSNNTPATAQVATVPFTAGGYLNVPGAGPDGRSKSGGDVVDLYRVTLSRDDLVMLSFDPQDPVGTPEAANALQLWLLDTSGNPVISNRAPVEGRSREESVRFFFVPRAGTFLIMVEAARGATNYQLVVDSYRGENLALENPAYAPGEVVARLRGNAASLAPGQSYRGLQVAAGGPGRASLLRFDPNRPEEAVAALGATHLLPPAAGVVGGEPELRGPITARTIATLLASDPDVETAGPNYKVYPHAVPNDPRLDEQWAWDNIDAFNAWDEADGSGVTVAVIDTGVYLQHPDLAANLVDGYDFVRSFAGNDNDRTPGIDPDPSPDGAGSHGTHVSGTVAAVTDNRVGVAGTASGARIMPLRALGAEFGFEYDVAQAIRFAAGLDNDSGTVPAERADVINMSLGGSEVSDWMQRTIYDAVRAGTVVVASAGNDNSAGPTYPAWYQNVISVASTTSSNGRSGFSNRGPMLDVAAPGSGIMSTWSTSSYRSISGTSMAAPHVAGWVALMLSVNPDLTPVDIDDIIANEDVFTDLGSRGRDDSYGFGLIDATKAIRVARSYTGGKPAVIPELGLTPDLVVVGPNQSSVFVTGQNIGDATLSVGQIRDDAAWLQTRGFTSTGSDIEFTVDVDRSSFGGDGIYEANVIIETDVGTHVMPVFVIQREAGGSADIGPRYAVLVDDSGDVAASVAAGDGGSFEMLDVAVGDYTLYAGTDLDNDGDLCDAGEACGAFSSLDDVQTVSVVDADVEGADVTADWVFSAAGEFER